MCHPKKSFDTPEQDRPATIFPQWRFRRVCRAPIFNIRFSPAALDLPEIEQKRFAQRNVCSVLRDPDFTRHAVGTGATANVQARPA